MTFKIIDEMVEAIMDLKDSNPAMGFLISTVEATLAFAAVSIILSVMIPILVVIVLVIGKTLLPVSILIYNTLIKIIGY